MFRLRSPPLPTLQPPCCAAGAQDQLPREPANSSMTDLCAKSAIKVASPGRPWLLWTWIFCAHPPDLLQLIPKAPHKTSFIGWRQSHGFTNVIEMLGCWRVYIFPSNSFPRDGKMFWWKSVFCISGSFSFSWAGQHSLLGFKTKYC